MTTDNYSPEVGKLVIVKTDPYSQDRKEYIARFQSTDSTSIRLGPYVDAGRFSMKGVVSGVERVLRAEEEGLPTVPEGNGEVDVQDFLVYGSIVLEKRVLYSVEPIREDILRDIGSDSK